MFEEYQNKNLCLSSDDENDEPDYDDFMDVETPGDENKKDEEENPPANEDDGIYFELQSEDTTLPISNENESERVADETNEEDDSFLIEDEDSNVEETSLPDSSSENEEKESFIEDDSVAEEEPTEEPEEQPAPTYPTEDGEIEEPEARESSSNGVTAGQAEIIKSILERITEEIEQIKKILPGEVEISGELSTSPDIDADENEEGNMIEGVFDGEGMVGSNGKQYDVPANYASKSKLVEGDILKLTINPDGSFLFKQIGPSERSRVVGALAYDPIQGRYLVTSGDKKWYILTASVTYFKGKPGDEAVILVPKSTPSRWAAVENIISKKEVS